MLESHRQHFDLEAERKQSHHVELTADIYQISGGMVSRWWVKRETIKIKVEIQKRRGKRQSRRAKRLQLLRWREARYVYTEKKLFEEIKKHQLSVHRVSGQWNNVKARQNPKFIHGEMIAAGFRSSHGWLVSFRDPNGSVQLRMTNSERQAIEKRLPLIARLHARLRQKKALPPKDGEAHNDTYGFWTQDCTCNSDPVPVRFANCQAVMVESKGEERSHIVHGGRADAKRETTAHLTVTAGCVKCGEGEKGVPISRNKLKPKLVVLC